MISDGVNITVLNGQATMQLLSDLCVSFAPLREALGGSRKERQGDRRV